MDSIRYKQQTTERQNDFFYTPDYYDPGVSDEYIKEARRSGFTNYKHAIRRASEIAQARENENEVIGMIRRAGYYV